MQALYLQNLVAANYHADQAAQKAARKRAAAAAAAAPPPQTAPEAHPTAAASPHGCHDVCAAPAGSATVTIIPAGSEGGGAVANTSYAAQPDRGLSTATAAEGAGLSTSAPLNACGVDASGVVLNVAPPPGEGDAPRSSGLCDVPRSSGLPAARQARRITSQSGYGSVRQSMRSQTKLYNSSRGDALTETLYLQLASPRR